MDSLDHPVALSSSIFMMRTSTVPLAWQSTPLLPDSHPERSQSKYPSNLVAIKVLFPQLGDRLQL